MKDAQPNADAPGGPRTTDIARWRDAANLDPAWGARAKLAADFIPAGAAVLDVGCGAMQLSGFLPGGCRYLPADIVARDARTIVCDLNAGQFPSAPGITHVTALGVLEYLLDVPAFLAWLRQTRCHAVISYCATDLAPELDRAALGWLNELSRRQIKTLFANAGFDVMSEDSSCYPNVVFALAPAAPRLRPQRSVAVLSFSNAGNFGDRLGHHVLRPILPPEAVVEQIYFRPWSPPAAPPDLLILGIGNSLFGPLVTDEVARLVQSSKKAIGIFGTQYREGLDRARFDAVLGSLETWFARYREDALLFGRAARSVVHLGDWLIDAFPMAQWKRDATLDIDAAVLKDLPLDRVIERIQAYRAVRSTRLHPLLCALTSAEFCAYREQREVAGGGHSGKFRSMLLDVFGRTFPEDAKWAVDRAAVVRYKAQVRRQMRVLADKIEALLYA